MQCNIPSNTSLSTDILCIPREFPLFQKLQWFTFWSPSLSRCRATTHALGMAFPQTSIRSNASSTCTVIFNHLTFPLSLRSISVFRWNRKWHLWAEQREADGSIFWRLLMHVFFLEIQCFRNQLMRLQWR